MKVFNGVDTVAFDRDVTRFFEREAPEDVVFGVNEIAKEVRKDLVAASPQGDEPNPYRSRNRAKRGVRGRGYGPIRKAWSRRSTRKITRPAVVVNLAFYAPMVEFGTPAHLIRGRRGRVLGPSAQGKYFGRQVRHPGARPRPFVAPVANRAGITAERVLRRVLPRR